MADKYVTWEELADIVKLSLKDEIGEYGRTGRHVIDADSLLAAIKRRVEKFEECKWK